LAYMCICERSIWASEQIPVASIEYRTKERRDDRFVSILLAAKSILYPAICEKMKATAEPLAVFALSRICHPYEFLVYI
jgi:hypothetical protein